VFSNLIELREGVSSGHSRRVADLARKIAIKLNFPATEAQDVMLAGLLHDVGKIGLPDELLSKPVSHMSGDELGLLRKHPVTGQAALMGLENLRKAGSFIRGTTSAGTVKVTRTGSPVWRSPMARVLAVANDFDALQIGTLSPRKLKLDEAVAFIQQNRGKRYCPQVVDALVEVLGATETAISTGNELSPSSLKPGMVLARDLVTRRRDAAGSRFCTRREPDPSVAGAGSHRRTSPVHRHSPGTAWRDPCPQREQPRNHVKYIIPAWRMLAHPNSHRLEMPFNTGMEPRRTAYTIHIAYPKHPACKAPSACRPSIDNKPPTPCKLPKHRPPLTHVTSTSRSTGRTESPLCRQAVASDGSLHLRVDRHRRNHCIGRPLLPLVDLHSGGHPDRLTHARPRDCDARCCTLPLPA
jgi:hypothetical protein